jgi:hypothetical protein
MPRTGLNIVLIALMATAGSALAQGPSETIWRCKDKNGHTHVTNLKDDTVGKDCRVIQRQRVTVVSPGDLRNMGGEGEQRKSGPSGRLKEDGAARASAKERQRQILEKELASETDLLAKARIALTEQESMRGGDERNFARVLERLKPYQDSVETHEKNVDSLKREIDNLYRN